MLRQIVKKSEVAKFRQMLLPAVKFGQMLLLPVGLDLWQPFFTDEQLLVGVLVQKQTSLLEKQNLQ